MKTFPIFKKRVKTCFAFTLVELIVVITILAILGTIGFLSLQGYSKSARDSERTTDLTNIGKGFDVLSAAGKLFPQPDANMMTITASGTTIGYQGYAGKNVISALSLGGKFQDPTDNQYYTYETNLAQNRYQVLGLLEDGGNLSLTINDFPGIDTAYAGTYDARYPLTKGASLGVLVGTGATLNQPVQELYAVGSFTGVDVVNTTGTYTAWFGKGNIISGTGVVLKKIEAVNTLASTGKDGINLNDIVNGSLVGYWDMETKTLDGKLRDLSGNSNDGTSIGGAVVGNSNGNSRNGKAVNFGGLVQYFNKSSSTSLNTANSLSISIWMYPTADYVGYAVHPITKWSSIGDANYVLYHFGTSNPGGPRWTGFYANRSGVWGPISSQYQIPLNTWTHVALSYTSGSGGQLYINGIPSGIRNGGGALALNTSDFNLGGDGDSFSGIIDEVRIYNRALSDADIQSLYNSTK